MHFDLVDAVLEKSDTRIVTLKHVTNAEEYLRDHFPEYPVLPGVLMLEAMVQAARRLAGAGRERFVLGQIRALKYGAFVRPGCSLRVEVELLKAGEDATLDFKGQATIVQPAGVPDEPKTAVSGRFSLRPVHGTREA